MMKKKVPKKQTVSGLKKKLWVVFSLYVRKRDKWTCITCGKREEGAQMHAGHYIPRQHNATLFDEKNVHAQCSRCNMFGSGEPHIYAEHLMKRYGKKEYEELVKRGKTIKKWSIKELEKMLEEYQKKQEEMER